MMGSALIPTRECPISDEYKKKILNLRLEDAEFRKRVLTPVHFDMNADRGRSASDETDWSEAASFSAAEMDRIVSVKELIESITDGAEEILGRWLMLKD